MNPPPAPRLADIRPCLEGAIPGVMASAATDGTPNVAYVSQVFYVDEEHVALSFQFFNKTRHNILANPHASVLVAHPYTGAFYRLHLRYLHTVTDGPVFEAMKAQLAGIASHSGMAGIFKLQGSDIYRLERLEAVPGQQLAQPAPRSAVLASLRRGSQALSRCTSLEELLSTALETLCAVCHTEHAMVLMCDPVTQRLYTVASCGYATSGLGSEIAPGQGVIGVAAEQRTPIRIGYMTTAYLYQRAVRSSWRSNHPQMPLDTDIPYPGLLEPHSQMATPIIHGDRVLGAMFVESVHDLHFDHEQEDMLVTLAAHLGAALQLMGDSSDPRDEPDPAPDTPRRRNSGGTVLRIKRYQLNNSVFIDDSYLIKGVAGAIFWKLVTEHVRLGRCEFSNRELRLDPDIGLPDLTDNLEARLLLLQRRLAEHAASIRIEKTGRGRFRLLVPHRLELLDHAG